MSARLGRWAMISAGAVILLVGAAVGISRLGSDMSAMVPAGDPAVARDVQFFSDIASTRSLIVEAEAVEPSADARGTLLSLVANVAPLGAVPARSQAADGAAKLVQVTLDHLPSLIVPQDLEQMAPQLAPAVLVDRLTALRRRIERPDDVLSAGVARQDVLGLTAVVLGGVTAGPAGTLMDGPLALHPDGRHWLLELRVDFQPDDVARGRPLLMAMNQVAATAREHGVIVRITGSYRHYVENAATVQSDLTATIPLEILLVAVVLWSLVRSWRALLAVHLPAVASVVGSLAGAAVWSVVSGHAVPVAMLGMIAGILGIAVDYGTHAVSAIQKGHQPVRELMLGYMTTVAAVACLFLSTVPALSCLAAMLMVGLGAALLTALQVRLTVAADAAGQRLWARIGQPLYGVVLAHRRWAMATVVAISLVCLAGVGRVSTVKDLRRLDGSSPQAWADLDAVLSRWGDSGAGTFVVAEATDSDAALAAAARTRAVVGVTPGILERLLPDRAEQQRRQANWNRFWNEHPGFSQDLATACRQVGLREQAFAATVALCQPATSAQSIITTESWAGTPLVSVLAPLLRHHRDGNWTAASPVPAQGHQAQDLIAVLPADAPGWIANRGALGGRMFAGIRSDLLALGPLILLVVAITLAIAVRSPRAVLAILLPPLLALGWTLGLHGWADLAITPLSVVTVTFILGIGVDTAVFLRAGRWSMPAVMAAWLTTVLGTGTMLIAVHPVVRSLGLSLTLGMSAAFVATLLITPVLAPDRREA